MGRIFNIFAATFIAIGSFLFGYDSGIIASVITMNHFQSFFGNPSKSLIGAVVATFTGGCFFGAAASGWWNDKFGRKRTIQIGCVWALWGCAMQSGANNIATLLIGRIVAGVAIGCLSMTVPLYNTEIAPPKIRGFIVGLAQEMIGIGFVVANWVGYGCQFIDSDVSWRLPLGLQLIPASLLLLGVNFLPFSPRWLLEHDRDDLAFATIMKLHGVKTAEDRKKAEEEFAVMHDAIKAEMLIRSRRISDLWASPAMIKRTLIACGVQIFGQFTGINVINYYGPQMYETLGLSPGKTLLVQGIYGAVGPITNFFFITLLVDRIGRKRPLLFGAATFVCTFSVLAAIVASFPPGSGETNFAAQRAGIAMIFLTSIVFSLSFGPVSWVLAAEVFPTRTRSIGTAVATCCNWAFNVLFSEVSPIAMSNVAWKFYVLFIALNFVSFVVILLFFPETKGKSLEEMTEIFGDPVDVENVLGRYGNMKSAHQNEVQLHVLLATITSGFIFIFFTLFSNYVLPYLSLSLSSIATTMKRLHRRQTTGIPDVPTGFSATVQLASSSVVNTGLIADNSATETGDANGVAITSTTVPSTTPSSTSATGSVDSSSIPLGAVIGICVGVFLGLAILILLVFIMFRCRSRKDGQDTRSSQRKNNGRWVKMNDEDGDASYEKYSMKARSAPGSSPTTTGGSTIQRSITVKSAKSAKTFKTGLGFSDAFKTPEVPPQLEFTDGDLGSGRVHTEEIDTLPPLSTVAAFSRVNAPTISWDGDTVRADSGQFAEYHMANGNVESPMSSMVGCFQTPPAVETSLHQWEQAEVVSPDGADDAYGGVESENRNPFTRSDQESSLHTQPQLDTQSITTTGSMRNPFEDNIPTSRAAATPVSLGAETMSSDSASFFSTHTDLTVRLGAFNAIEHLRPSEPQFIQHERSESSEHAMASLIAALNISPEEARERLSAAVLPTPRASAASALSFGAPSAVTNESNYSESETLDEAGYRRFPLPPTDIEHHS